MNYSWLFKKLTGTYGSLSASLPKGYALPPIHTIIEVTYGCNLRCKMCYQQELRKKGLKLSQELTTSEIKSVIDWMLPKTLITLTGGELFTRFFSRKDALEIIKYCCKNHYCNIITNAALINEEIAQNLVKSGVTLVGVSIDGIGNTHDEIRRVKGTFDRAIKSIKLIQKIKKKSSSKFPMIDLKTVLLKENVKEITQLYELCRELDVDYFTLSAAKPDESIVMPPVVNSIPQKDFYHFPKIKEVLPYEDMLHQLNSIRKATNKRPILRFYPENIDTKIKEYYTNTLPIKNYADCFFPWRTMGISPFGDVFPCYQIKMGNIRKESLGQIWNGQKFKQFRTALRKNGIYPACHGCCNAQVIN